MRKRIVIGVIAAVAIEVGVYVLTLPKKGTVEWHSARYVALLTEDSWAERLSQMWERLRGRRGVLRRPPERVFKELQLHEKALVKLGYFEERRFLVFDGRAEGVMTRAISFWRSTQSNAIVRPQFDTVFVVGGTGTKWDGECPKHWEEERRRACGELDHCDPAGTHASMGGIGTTQRFGRAKEMGRHYQYRSQKPFRAGAEMRRHAQVRFLIMEGFADSAKMGV